MSAADLFSTATTSRGVRSWTIEDHGERPLTVNAVAKMHRQAWAKITREHRERWGWLARAHRVPHLDAARFVAVPLHRDARSPQDVAACAPAVKAAIDGLVDAGVIDDDSPKYVRSVEFRAPEVCGVDGLRLTIIAEVLR